MKISQLYQQKAFVVSFEVFPPKKESSIDSLYQTINELGALKPDYISVTYGAGGSESNNQTLAIAATIKARYGIEALHHLTCIQKSKKQITTILQAMKDQQVKNVLALRGDLPHDAVDWDDYHLAKDLIHEIKQDTWFSASATCYPEGHITQLGARENMEHLLAKQNAGADYLISQLFFDNNVFYQLLEDCQKAGVTLPISAGVMPILSRSQVEKMIFMCGSSLPADLIKIISRYESDLSSLRAAGLEYALKQMEDLQKNNVAGIHVYTMNRPEIAQASMQLLKG